MRVTSKCHIKALAENLELGLIGGVLASAVDSFWVVCDICHNGMSVHYTIILTSLLLSTLVLMIALIRHHKANVKQELGVLFAFKKEVCRTKARHMRRAS